MSQLLNLTIISQLQPLYLMEVNSDNGIKSYEGIMVDIADEMAKQMNATYNMIALDIGYSSDPVLDELLNSDDNLTIALSTITISKDRLDRGIGLSFPWATVGISLLARKPETEAHLFSFLGPLDATVWFGILAAFLAVCFLLYVMSKSKLEEKYRSHERLDNSIWFTFAALVGQGQDVALRTPGSKILIASWWMFVLLIVNSYTANLAAFQTVSQMSREIGSLDDLVHQTKYEYGVVNNTMTQWTIQKSRNENFKRVAAYLRENPENLVNSVEEGIQRVKTENYIFIEEIIPLKYAASQDCSLEVVGGQLNTAFFGVAMKADHFMSIVDDIILDLTASDIIDFTIEKWENKMDKCKAQGKVKSVNGLGFLQLSGIFLLLGVGICVSVCTYIFHLFSFNKNTMKTRKKKSIKNDNTHK